MTEIILMVIIGLLLMAVGYQIGRIETLMELIQDEPRNITKQIAARCSTPTESRSSVGDLSVHRCGLCGNECNPVNHHGDCRLCSEAQYGDR